MRNFLKRLVISLGLIALMILVTIVLVAPQVVADLATRMAEAATPIRIVEVLAAILIDAVLIGLVYRTAFPDRMEGLTVRARGAKTAVSIDSVQRQINNTIAQVSDVLAVQTEVVDEQGDVRVALRVRTRPDIMVPEKQKEINRTLRQVVEKQLGLRLAGPATIHIALSADDYETTEERATLITTERGYVTPEPLPRYALASRATPSGEPEAIEEEEEEAPARPVYAPAPAAVVEEDEEEEQPAVETEATPEPEAEPWRAFLLEDEDTHTEREG